MRRLLAAACICASLVPGPAPAQSGGELTGSIYRADASSARANAQVSLATAVPGLQVYLRPLDSDKWIGPVSTDAYGRFVFHRVANGSYQLRAYSGKTRVWDQTVSAPAILPKIVVRDVVVAYYIKAADSAKVTAVLATLGYPYELRDQVIDTPTNTVWFGDNVRIEDVKALASALIRGGITLRACRRFASGGGEKANLMEVGAAAANVRNRPLTLKEIEAAKDWPRSS
jgi:hypothetical protein